MKSILVLLLATFFLNSFAQDWVQYQKKEAGFKILFPDTPTESVKEKAKVTYKAKIRQGLSTFSVNATVHTTDMESIDGVTKRSFDAFVKALNGKVEEKSTFTVNSRKGIHAKIVSAKGSYVYYRVIIVGKIQYQLYVTSIKKYTDKEMVDQFFNSFELLEDKPEQGKSGSNTQGKKQGKQAGH